MSRYVKRATLFLISLFVAVSINNISIMAETETPEDLTVIVDNSEGKTVHGLHFGYQNNIYVSLVDMQKLLEGTAKEFRVNISDGEINVYTNNAVHGEILDISPEDIPEFSDADRDVGGWSSEQISAFSNKAMALNSLHINGRERRYYTILVNLGGCSDCFIHISDFCLLLDLDAQLNGKTISINTAGGMKPVNPLELEDIGFFQGVNTVLVGDATTGEIFYSYKGDEAYPIASTTKLMTYLLMADAIASGRIAYTDMVSISKEAEDLSATLDGLIPMKEGQDDVPLSDLIDAALIISSNECDHLVSEHFGGDEASVVAMMNDKAAKLSMTTAEFYNCNGLPIYSETLIPAKKQNRMSSKDMFKLASHILNTYPEIKEITGTKRKKSESLNKELKNTNPLLYNMTEVNGMKTGTTNRSGACLVTSLTVNDGTIDHDLVVVEFGAESSNERGRVSELMARYAKAVVLKEAQKVSVSADYEADLSANSIVTMILNCVK